MSVRSKLINKLFKDATKLAKNYDYMVKCDTELCSEISFLFAYDLDTCTDKDIRSFIERKFKNLPEGCDEFTGLVIKDCTFTIEPIELVNTCATDIDILEQGNVYLRSTVSSYAEVTANVELTVLLQSEVTAFSSISITN